MIISKQKPFEEILAMLKECQKVFLVGCGECATTCKSGGESELKEIKKQLESKGKIVLGICIPEAPCLASKVKMELAKSSSALREAEALLVFACGLGVQSVKNNYRGNAAVLPGVNTFFGAIMDAKGNFFEKCSMCGECVLEMTEGICPVTLCAKGLMNGPCGGMDKGKCEVDKEKDCAWVLIYKELEKKNKTAKFRQILSARDHRKSAKPQQLIIN
ncbi:MAG: methylenetetrahydrofolate reductase C-terminal domain-containing protein [Candidatus Omnitrophica bacterium]|nr:methylenetetrahydrofolate reductase C-terminal domain-containing protein [Candidatus Omnitrophota bacterium]